MSTLQDVKVFPLRESERFENLCLDIWKRKINDQHIQRNGRRGQEQHGVDIFGRRDGSMNWVGIQCKVKSMGDRLTETEVEEEIRKAMTFNPRLSEYIFATTAPRDQRLQEFVRQKTVDHLNQGLFIVNVVFWDDIELDLAEDNNLDICYKYYKDFFIDVKNFGNTIGKLIAIEIGVGDSPDTHYELIVGKIPMRSQDEDYFGLNYYKGSNYIVNLNEKTFDTFPVPCYPSDLEHLFRFNRDAKIISEWINRINLEDLVYGSEVNYQSTITYEEYIKLGV